MAIRKRRRKGQRSTMKTTRPARSSCAPPQGSVRARDASHCVRIAIRTGQMTIQSLQTAVSSGQEPVHSLQDPTRTGQNAIRSEWIAIHDGRNAV
jgi:hypothetical protein